jgi:hypothetical protein
MGASGQGEGDACETDGDSDNDGLTNAEDTNPLGARGICAAFAGADDGHPNSVAGDLTNDGNANRAPFMGTNTADTGPSWDMDGDGALDGVECAQGHNLRSSGDAPTLGECGGQADLDGDGLRDPWETCGWGTPKSAIGSGRHAGASGRRQSRAPHDIHHDHRCGRYQQHGPSQGPE